jgi:hypothetical protein
LHDDDDDNRRSFIAAATSVLNIDAAQAESMNELLKYDACTQSLMFVFVVLLHFFHPIPIHR